MSLCRRSQSFRLRFEPLVDGEEPIEVPCDADGFVDLDELDDSQREGYLYARVVRNLRFAMRIVPVARR